MNLFESIDLYCERLSASLLAEPLNLFSNLSFILAAWVLQKQLKTISSVVKHKVFLQRLIYLIYTIGIGSALFHSFANKISQIADVIPIAVFIFIFLYFYLAKVIKLNVWRNLSVFMLFFVLTGVLVVLFPPQLVNGSSTYFGTCLLLCGIYFNELRSKRNSRNYFGMAAIVFISSLSFRTIDSLMCEYFSYGTHFMWHLLNGLLIYLVMMGAMRSLVEVSSPPPKIN